MGRRSARHVKVEIAPDSAECARQLAALRVSQLALHLDHALVLDDVKLNAYLDQQDAPRPRSKHPRHALDKLRESIRDKGFDGAVRPITVAPAPPAILSPHEQRLQTQALKQLDTLDIDRLVQLDRQAFSNLQLRVLDGRARCKIFYGKLGDIDGDGDGEDEAPRRKKRKVSKTTRLEMPHWIPVVLLKPDVWKNALVLKHFHVDTTLAHSLPYVSDTATTGRLILIYASSRRLGCAPRRPVWKERPLAASLKAVLGTRGVVEAAEAFLKDKSASSVIFSYCDSPTSACLFGKAAPRTAELLLLGAASTSHFLASLARYLDAPLSLPAVAVLARVSSEEGWLNPYYDPPSLGEGAREGPDEGFSARVRRRGGRLADLVEERISPSMSVRRLRVPSGGGVGRFDREYEANGPLRDDQDCPAAFFVELKSAVDEIHGLVRALRDERWAQDAVETDRAAMGELILPDLVRTLEPPSEPVVASAFAEPRQMSVLASQLVFFDKAILERVINGFSSIAKDRLEHLDDDADAPPASTTLEGALVSLLSPDTAKHYDSQRQAGAWGVEPWLVDISQSLLKHLWLHRHALIASFALLDANADAGADTSTDLFGDTTSPSLFLADLTRRTRSIWATEAGQQILELVAEETARRAPADQDARPDIDQNDTPSSSVRRTNSPLVDFTAAHEAWSNVLGGVDSAAAATGARFDRRVRSMTRAVRDVLNVGGHHSSMQDETEQCARRAVDEHEERRRGGDEAEPSGAAGGATPGEPSQSGGSRSSPRRRGSASEEEDESGAGGSRGGRPSSGHSSSRGDARASAASPGAPGARSRSRVRAGPAAGGSAASEGDPSAGECSTAATTAALAECWLAASEVTAHLAVLRRAHALPVRFLAVHFARWAYADAAGDEGDPPVAASSLDDLPANIRTRLRASVLDRTWLDLALDYFFREESPLSLDEYARFGPSPFDLALLAVVTNAIERRVMSWRAREEVEVEDEEVVELEKMERSVREREEVWRSALEAMMEEIAALGGPPGTVSSRWTVVKDVSTKQDGFDGRVSATGSRRNVRQRKTARQRALI